MIEKSLIPMAYDDAVMYGDESALVAEMPSGQWLTPSSDIDRYIAKVRQIPMLEAEEEYQLALALHQDNNLAAAQKLVVHHLKFVVHIARGFNGYGLPMGDLIQEGNIGLMKAVKRFEPSRGVRLVSFAVHWIKSEIHEYVIRNWRMVKVATTKAQRKLFFNLRSMKKGLHWLTDQEASTIASELNVSKKDVLEMEQRIHGQDISFSLHDDEEEDNGFSPEMWLSDEEADPAHHLAHHEHEQLMHSRLQEGLKKLDERSRAIVEARWLDENSKATLQTLAEQYQVSAERIRQIESQAMNQLKGYLNA
ncbi:MAG: RNA polymerase sigma factor RpoH [Cardiobacteriaceae bacterium]|nr:RNA polymerase sigma factor RpoH [Cardiobacteriaceae bacterium]